MPNLTGGKKYKSQKHGSDTAAAFIERMSDQHYGRILKNMGDRNVLVYSNDNKIRLCHIRGSIRKNMWINIGDIVLISMRDELKETTEYERGDILYKYSSEHYSKLKSDSTMNQRLFLNLEKHTPEDLKRMEGSGFQVTNTEDFFDFTEEDLDGI